MPFSARETEDALCISVVTKGGGIRRSDKTAWDSLTKAISETDRETVLLYSASPIFGADAFENRVLCDYVASLQKNVFVISRGETNAVKNMGGVYFITLGAPARTSLSAEHIRTIEYLAFSLSGTPSFTFKSQF